MFDQDLLLEFFEGKDKDAGTYSTWFQGLFLKISVFEFGHGLEIIRSPPGRERPWKSSSTKTPQNDKTAEKRPWQKADGSKPTLASGGHIIIGLN